MKRRKTFVSNSSSSSFIIGIKNPELELTSEYILKEIFKIEKDNILYDLAKGIAKALVSKKDIYDYDQFLEEMGWDNLEDIYNDELKSLVKKIRDCGGKFIGGYAHDDTGDIGENALVAIGIDYEDENIFVYKESYY